MEWLHRLRDIKANSKLTTREIANKSGIPEPTLEKLFSGQTKDPKLNTMIQLVQSLGYTLDDLAPISAEQQKTAATILESGLNEADIKIAHAYHDVSEGMQESVRKLLDVALDEPDVFTGSTQSTAKMA